MQGGITARLTFKYRLQPTKAQCTVLENTLELCRWVYNETLATRKNAWEQKHKFTTLFDTIEMLPKWKEAKPELNQVYAQVLQEAQKRVDLAFRAFFRRVKAGEKPGYPRFRGKGRYDSFTYFQNYPNNSFKLQDNQLDLPKIGKIRIVLHRPIQGTIKTLTIRRDKIGNWYACFSCEVEPLILPKSNKAVGIDVGLESFATLSNGKKIANPRFLRRDEKELVKAQRKLVKIVKNSPKWKKCVRVIQHIHQRITNRRKDFLHKISHSLVNEYGIIALEKLNEKDMLQNHCLAKSISDAAWSQFARYVTYKAEYAGRVVVLVDPRNTSKRCSRCGVLVEKTLSVRIHKCPVCDLEIDRDINAAINILALGLQCLGKTPKSCSE